MTRDRSFPLLLLCFFLSGLAALVYETAWTREFAFVFGTSDLAVATVLAAYMGGLASGAALAGRLTPRIARPVLAYGLLELGIALAALAVPVAIGASRILYVAAFGGQGALPEGGGSATALFYLVCSFLILLVPTAMMGATLPLLVRHAVRDEAQIGSRTGALYAVNTAGAVVGTLVAAFVLLPVIGLRATIWAGAGVNLAVFLAAWALARVAVPVPASPRRRALSESAGASVGRAAWILPLIFTSGVVSFTYEVFWVRLLVHLVGSSVQAFATMLASFLTGIALGAALASRFASTPRRSSLGFALAQLGIAALSLAAFAGVDRIPGLGETLVARDLPPRLVDTIACMLTLFPSALCIGATFPFAIRVLARGEQDAGPASARVYAANTLGAIIGSVGAGFFAMPGLRFAGTLTACVATNLGLAGAAALLLEPRRHVLLAAACAGGVALALLPVATPWAVLRASPLGGNPPAWGRVEYFGVGRSATVLLLDQRLSWNLRTNGLPESGTVHPEFWANRYPLMRWLTALPLLARPEARSLLLVGLGVGTALEVVPATVERIDVVEIEPEVVAANRSVADRRLRDPLSDPRVHVHINDARNALLLAEKQRFDVIVSQPSHPWSGGAAHLYTQEFFELVASRLSEDGVFVQWIGLSFVDESLFRSLLAALSQTFAHVRVYRPPPGGAVLFIASPAPLDVEATAPRSIEAAPEDFAALGIRFAEQVTASLELDDAGVRALAAGAAPNRDGHNRLQMRSARLGADALRGGIDELSAPHDPLLGPRPGGEHFFVVLRSLPPGRAMRVAEGLPEGVERKIALALAGIADGKREGPRRLLEEALREVPRDEEARAALLRLSANEIVEGTDPEAVLAAPLSDVERVVASAWRARSADAAGTALRAFETPLAAVPSQHPLAPDAARLRIDWRLRSGEPERVREAMVLADDSLGDRPDPPSLLLRAEAYAAAGQHAAALDTLYLLGERLDLRSTVSLAYQRRAGELLRSTPADPELAWQRRRAQRLLSGR
jgi:spermidine synthase